MVDWNQKCKAFLCGIFLQTGRDGSLSGKLKKLLLKVADFRGILPEMEEISKSLEPWLPLGCGRKQKFFSEPTLEITHPISGQRLNIELSNLTPGNDIFIKIMTSLVQKEPVPPKQLFFQLFEFWKEELAGSDPVSGPLWQKFPFSHDLPDHSLWQQSALLSAIQVSNEPHLLFFSFGPMSFVETSATLREFWSASLVLSFLLWSGMRVICDDYGPDHLLYPAISGQPFFRHWLRQKGFAEGMKDIEMQKLGIPAFSNSCVALLPGKAISGIMQKITDSIQGDWQTIAESVYEGLFADAKIKPNRTNWEGQIRNYLTIRGAHAPWFSNLEDKLLNETYPDLSAIKRLYKIFQDSDNKNPAPGLLYQFSHQLSHMRHMEFKKSVREKENQKVTENPCPLCGRHSALATMPSPKALASDIQNNPANADTESTKLCAICITRQALAKNFHSAPPTLQDAFRNFKFKEHFSDKRTAEYLAIISMDGDRMGNLTQGKNENFAKWWQIFHSEVSRQIAGKNGPELSGALKRIAEIAQEKRHLYPYVHQFLSESLADFSLISAPYVIHKYGGQLLYLGGDDVVAALPVKNALQAAHELRDLYRAPFVILRTDGSPKICTSLYQPQAGERLLSHLGKAVTMSAAVVFAHQGEHAGRLLKFARAMLDDEAKDHAGRDAVAIVLKNTTGSNTLLSGKWETAKGERFIDIILNNARKVREKKSINVPPEHHRLADFIAVYLS